jgi:hypothetical protein
VSGDRDEAVAAVEAAWDRLDDDRRGGSR